MTTNDEFSKLQFAESDGVAVMTIASDKVNALDVATLKEMATLVERCEDAPDIRGLVVTGQGSIFSAGLNVSEVLDSEKSHTATLLDALNEALVRLFRFPKPTVAALNGPAIAGGCILACACDKRLMAEGARIGATELRVGVSFPVFAVELLRHACGGPQAEQLMFDAALLTAEAARASGLVHQVVAAGDLDAAAIALTAELASLDASAYALAKATSRQGALSVLDNDTYQRIDRAVLAHWQDDATRVSLERLRKPKS
jgi:enoyl-CoA hydratase